MAKKKKKQRAPQQAQGEAKASSRREGDTAQVRRVKELRDQPVRERSVDNDILFSLPAIKAMLGALAVGIVCYVLSYFGETLGIGQMQQAFHIASYALFAISFVLLVIGRVQGKHRTAQRRAEQR